MDSKRIALFHGHQWDEYDRVNWKKRLIVFIYQLYYSLGEHKRLLEPLRWFTYHGLKRFAKLISGNERQQQAGALAWLAKHDYDVLICGHTHMPTTHRVGKRLVVNTGCWTSPHPTYVIQHHNWIGLLSHDHRILRKEVL